MDIFCTLFGTTKRKDDRQTGGFGLGSKAGFAYRDHFQVTSIHGGIKTIYQMHLGGIEDDGMPLCQPIVTVPSTEPSGIEIKIEVEERDREDFTQNVLRISCEGALNVTFNDKVIPVPDFSEIDAVGYGFVKTSDLTGGFHRRRSDIVVRLGSVIYPLDDHDRFVNYARTLSANMPDEMTLVISMPPNSVQMTPSRESLSYNVQSVDALTNRLRPLANNVTARRDKIVKAAREAYAKTLKRLELYHENFDGRGWGKHLPKRSATAGLEAMAVAAAHRVHGNRGWGTDDAVLKIARKRIPEKRQEKWRKNLRYNLRLITRVAEDLRLYLVRNGSSRPARLNFIRKKSAIEANGYRRYGHDEDYYRVESLGRTVARMEKLRLVLTKNSINMPATNLVDNEAFFVIYTKDLLQVQIVEITKRAKKLGIDVIRVADPVPKPKMAPVLKELKIVEPDKFRVPKRLEHPHTYSNSRAWYSLEDMTLNAAPDSYIWMESKMRNYADCVPLNLGDAPTDFLRLFPSTAIATKEKDLEKLKAMGLPSVQEVLLARLAQQIKERPLHQYLLMSFGQANCSGRGHGLQLEALSSRVMIPVLGLKVKDIEAFDYDRTVWRFAYRVFARAGIGPVSPEDVESYHKLKEAAKTRMSPEVKAIVASYEQSTLTKTLHIFQVEQFFNDYYRKGEKDQFLLDITSAFNAFNKGKRKENRA